MNLYVTDPSPRQSARNLDDQNVIKQLIEATQMLATALHIHGAPMDLMPRTQDGRIFRCAFVEHPVWVWARLNRSNYLWVLHCLDQLHREYEIFARHPHVLVRSLEGTSEGAYFIPEGAQTPFHNSSLFKSELDPVRAYRRSMIQKWSQSRQRPTWWNRQPPGWVNLELIYRAQRRLI